ncbi:MAG: hypothetical protein IT460_02615 [Planctomycetes bacterium]|nr:hypothetical protein [Planctomycetota bacterium]
MSRARRALWIAVPAVVAACGLASVVAAGDDAPPASVAGIKDLMLTVNEGPTSVVGQLRDAFAQKELDDEAWGFAKARATVVAETAVMLWGKKPPIGADDDAGLSKWRAHVRAYRGCADAALEAIAKKDVAAGKLAIQQLSKKCNECHKDHRKEE